MDADGNASNDELDQASRAAWLYHGGELTQAEVAAVLGVTGAKVQRLLARATDAGIVRVLVEGPIGGCMEAERLLSRRYGLATCRVVPGLPEDGPLPLRALGKAGAAFVRQTLDGVSDLVVGLGHGRSLAACMGHLPRIEAPGLRLVSLLGGQPRLRPASSYEVMHRLVERTGAEAWLMPVPFFAGSADDREVLLRQAGVRDALALARNASLCLVGIGEVGGDAFLRQSGAVSAADEAVLGQSGAVAEMLGHYFDKAGRLLATPLQARVLAAPLPLLRGVTAIAGGPAKDEAILAALRSGVLHGPGTALTLELQEDSDVLSMFQALNAGRIISKELLYKDVSATDRRARAERAPLGFVDWDRNGDPDLYAHTHLAPVPVAGVPAWGRRDWVFFGLPKFSGQRVVIDPGRTARITEPGVYSVFGWSGAGTWDGHDLVGGEPGRDELLVARDTAVAGVEVVNPGTEPLVAYLLSGPDLHPEAADVVLP